jgi:hypothetical protein
MSKLTIVRPYTDYIQLLPGNKGLSIDPKTPFESYQEAVRSYGAVIADGLWALGDLFIFGERTYAEKFAQAIEPLQYTEKTVSNATWVCNEFPPSRRHAKLTFNHHMAVAALEPGDREAILNQAEKEELTVKEVTEIKKAKFPKQKKAGKTKAKKEGSDDAPPAPKEEKTDIVTLADALEHADYLISFFEQQDPKVKFTPQFRQDLGARLNVVRRQARRFGYFGGNK